MPSSFIIEHDPHTGQWATYVWIEGVHTPEDKYLCNGTEDLHDTLDAACQRITAWQNVDHIVGRDRGPWGAPSADDIVVEAIAPGTWSVLEDSGQRCLVWDHVEAIRKGCTEVSKLTS